MSQTVTTQRHRRAAAIQLDHHRDSTRATAALVKNGMPPPLATQAVADVRREQRARNRRRGLLPLAAGAALVGCFLGVRALMGESWWVLLALGALPLAFGLAKILFGFGRFRDEGP